MEHSNANCLGCSSTVCSKFDKRNRPCGCGTSIQQERELGRVEFRDVSDSRRLISLGDRGPSWHKWLLHRAVNYTREFNCCTRLSSIGDQSSFSTNGIWTFPLCENNAAESFFRQSLARLPLDEFSRNGDSARGRASSDLTQ